MIDIPHCQIYPYSPYALFGSGCLITTLTLTGSGARDVASRNHLTAFSATFKVEHHLRFNRYTQCHGCHKFGHHTLRCTNTPRCRWCAGAHPMRDHTCPTSTCNAKSRPCSHTLLKCDACAGVTTVVVTELIEYQ